MYERASIMGWSSGRHGHAGMCAQLTLGAAAQSALNQVILVNIYFEQLH